MIITTISVLLILAGLIFFLGAAVGVIRFPEFYTRMHAAGKGDTLSSLLVLLGFAVYQLHDFESFSESWLVLLVILKLIAISAFILITSPTSTHALMDAGWEDKISPEIAKGRSNHLTEDCPKRK
ncbi:monovalent cation/H(+) antiporter subunit G [Verrucomicrobiales bacterium BCK34]|nr:monovalent cation/H(+) antiporter subunit G [Verrucomicrobiales bacterium BCK34]